MGTLVMSQRWLVLASLVTLVLAAGCSVAVPHYSSRALNAAAFARDKAVSNLHLTMLLWVALCVAGFEGMSCPVFGCAAHPECLHVSVFPPSLLFICLSPGLLRSLRGVCEE